MRGLIAGAAAPAVWLAPARAQAKARRLGVLSQGGAAVQTAPAFREFKQGLRELGWAEGQNLAMEWRYAEGSFEALPRLAAELAGLPVDVIVATPTASALAAKAATRTVPVVFVQVADPIASGIVTNLARPGGNVTGLSSVAPDLSGKRLAILKEALPRAARVAVLWNRPNRAAGLVFEEMRRTKAQVGLELDDIGIADRSELADAFATAVGARAAAVMVIDDPLIVSYQAPVVALAARHALPVFSMYSEYVDGGGLMAYGPSLPALYRRAAVYVDRIFKGANPGELPVERPTAFELVINLKSASTLGLDLPSTLVARADRVIE